MSIGLAANLAIFRIFLLRLYTQLIPTDLDGITHRLLRVIRLMRSVGTRRIKKARLIKAGFLVGLIF